MSVEPRDHPQLEDSPALDSERHPDGQSAPRRIELLSATLANQIAAGEVVERPASVLKELLENALDAGADKIEIELAHGGISIIKVRDNGAGILAADLGLALSRHATSKIRSLEELDRVASLGFRGEALPSIASVARLEIASRPARQSQGQSVVVEGEATPAISRPAAMPFGTQVVVQDLFFNTPARKKFLRTEKTEFRHAEETARRVALSRFDVGVKLTHNGRTVWSVRPASNEPERLRRVSKLCGRPFCDHALELEFEEAGLQLHGWVATPSYHRSSTDLQHFFLNGRMIKDRIVSHAIRQAYAEHLPEGGHAAYVLYLSLDPAEVDINVHPAKHEVRFRNSRNVHDFVFAAVHNALKHSVVGGPLPLEDTLSTGVRRRLHDGGVGRYTVPPSPGRFGDYKRLYDTSKQRPDGYAETAPTAAFRLGRAVGTIGGQFVVALAGDRLLLIEVESARWNIVEAELVATLHKDGAVKSMPLLVPVSINVGDESLSLLEHHMDWLAVVGVELMAGAPGVIVVRKLPAALLVPRPEALIDELLSTLETASAVDANTLITCLACHDARHYRLPDEIGTLNVLLRSLESALADARLPDYVSAYDANALRELTRPRRS